MVGQLGGGDSCAEEGSRRKGKSSSLLLSGGRHLTRFAKFEKILLKKSQKNSAQLHPLFNLFSGFFTNTVLIHPLILPNKQMTR